jgi:hypothetical protein
MGLRYLPGCSSLNSDDPAEGWQTYRRLEDFRVPPEFETAPTAACACPEELQGRDAQPFCCHQNRSLPDDFAPAPVPTPVKIPKQHKTYLANGVRIAAPPAWDREFRSIDFLTFLDLKLLSAAARNRFPAPLTQ